MNIFVDKESLNISFSFKERLKILFKGKCKINRKDAYAFSSVLMHIIVNTIDKVGDHRIHGYLKKEDYIKDGS